MNKRTPLRPARKTPLQLRSKATVELILDATVRILDREGPDSATTTRIAEVAGVGIGTLYQYFAHRDAIVDALQDREFERATTFVEGALENADHLSERHVARRIIQGLCELYATAPALHRLLALEGLRITPTERVQAFDLRMVSVIRVFLAS